MSTAETESPLTKALVPDTSMWRLCLRIDPKALSVVAYSTVEDNSLIYRRIELDPAADSQLRAIEDAVYDNPLLLSDFQRVYVTVAADCYMLMPAECAADADLRRSTLLELFPEFDGDIFSCDCGTRNVRLVMGLDNHLTGFLNRTFLNPRITHSLAALSRYFITNNPAANAVKTYINLRAGRLDIIIAEKGRLLLANTFTCPTPSDALYYTLAARSLFALDNDTDELLLAGDTSSREQLMPLLRRYVAKVMPAIFPSTMFRAGKDAMNAPFDLIVMPLCE